MLVVLDSEDSGRIRDRAGNRPVTRAKSEAREPESLTRSPHHQRAHHSNVPVSSPPSPFSRPPIVICDSATEKFFLARGSNRFVPKEGKNMLAAGSLEEWIEYTVYLEYDGASSFIIIIIFLLFAEASSELFIFCRRI